MARVHILHHHQLKGQICSSTPAGKTKPCGREATHIGFGVRMEQDKPTDMVSWFFSCEKCTLQKDRCKSCPHIDAAAY